MALKSRIIFYLAGLAGASYLLGQVLLVFLFGAGAVLYTSVGVLTVAASPATRGMSMVGGRLRSGWGEAAPSHPSMKTVSKNLTDAGGAVGEMCKDDKETFVMHNARKGLGKVSGQFMGSVKGAIK